MFSAASLAPRLLIVEDEAPMRRFLRSFLSRYNFQLDEAGAGAEALATAAENPPDLILLDLGLPDMDGQELILRLREWLQSPIIVLSVRNQDKQKIAALNHGADDYLTKPFSTGELLARIQAALRRARSDVASNAPAAFECHELKVDMAARRVFVCGKEVRLTRLEYKLLVTMVRYAGKVLTHQFLLGEVWGPKHAENPQHLRVFMAGLRRKIETESARPRYLLTEQGVGYRLATE